MRHRLHVRSAAFPAAAPESSRSVGEAKRGCSVERGAASELPAAEKAFSAGRSCPVGSERHDVEDVRRHRREAIGDINLNRTRLLRPPPEQPRRESRGVIARTHDREEPDVHRPPPRFLAVPVRSGLPMRWRASPRAASPSWSSSASAVVASSSTTSAASRFKSATTRAVGLAGLPQSTWHEWQNLPRRRGWCGHAGVGQRPLRFRCRTSVKRRCSSSVRGAGRAGRATETARVDGCPTSVA